jgi:hypothetical protein
MVRKAAYLRRDAYSMTRAAVYELLGASWSRIMSRTYCRNRAV